MLSYPHFLHQLKCNSSKVFFFVVLALRGERGTVRLVPAQAAANAFDDVYPNALCGRSWLYSSGQSFSSTRVAKILNVTLCACWTIQLKA